MISKIDLYNHIISNGCTIEPLGDINNTANSIRFKNPKIGGRAYMSSPIDADLITFDNAQRICVQLGIPPYLPPNSPQNLPRPPIAPSPRSTWNKK